MTLKEDEWSYIGRDSIFCFPFILQFICAMRDWPRIGWMKLMTLINFACKFVRKGKCSAAKKEKNCPAWMKKHRKETWIKQISQGGCFESAMKSWTAEQMSLWLCPRVEAVNWKIMGIVSSRPNSQKGILICFLKIVKWHYKKKNPLSFPHCWRRTGRSASDLCG